MRIVHEPMKYKTPPDVAVDIEEEQGDKEPVEKLIA